MKVSERNASHMILALEPYPGLDLGPDLLPPPREADGIDFTDCPLADRARQKQAERVRLGDQKMRTVGARRQE